MQTVIGDIFPMEVITSMLDDAVKEDVTNMFPHDVSGHLMNLLVELYIKHYSLGPIGNSFS